MLALFAAAFAAQASALAPPQPDWLVGGVSTPASVQSPDNSTLSLENGLVRRIFTLKPGFGTVDLRNEGSGLSALRHVLPEAEFRINGTDYVLGGLYIADVPSPTGPTYTGQHAYLNRTGLLDRLEVRPNAWTYAEHWVGTPEADLPWTPGRRNSPSDASWPPKGARLSVRFAPPASTPAGSPLLSLNLTLVYELYQGAPMLSKWLEAGLLPDAPPPTDPILIEALTTELLPVNCDQSPSAEKNAGGFVSGLLHAQTTAAHGSAIVWQVSTNITNDPGACEPVLNVSYSPSLGVLIGSPAAGLITDKFASFRTILLLHDSFDPTRQMLARHQVYRRLAPWIQENLLELHLTDASQLAFDTALEQIVDVGFEALVLSFGSGFNFELDPSDKRVDKLADNVGKANAMGIEVGGYDLVDLDRGHGGYGGNVGDQWDCVDPSSGDLTANACYASGWRDKLEEMLFGITHKANITIVTTDGPYGGAPCASENHTHHFGLMDSVYQQTRLQAEYYRTMLREGRFCRQPDTYYFDGGQHSPLGYNEQQYSLPRWADLTVSRQGLLDDVYQKPAVMGWMFLPMKPYHAGGDGASFQPYAEHMTEYRFALAQYLGSGCAMTFRGDKLYDKRGDASHQLVKAQVAWFKQYRDIITSDIVHVRRPNGQDIDAFMHVNPRLPLHRALLMAFNPTTEPLSTTLRVDLYYAGLTDKANITVVGAQPQTVELSRDYGVDISVSIEAKSAVWATIEVPRA